MISSFSKNTNLKQNHYITGRIMTNRQRHRNFFLMQYFVNTITGRLIFSHAPWWSDPTAGFYSELWGVKTSPHWPFCLLPLPSYMSGCSVPHFLSPPPALWTADRYTHAPVPPIPFHSCTNMSVSPPQLPPRVPQEPVHLLPPERDGGRRKI